MSDMLDKDVTKMLATCPQQVVRFRLVEFRKRHDTRTNGQHYTPVNRRPISQVSAWQAERESLPTRPIVEVDSRFTTGSSMGAAILDPPSWILVMFQLKIISF